MKEKRDYKSESVREFDRYAKDYDDRSPFYYQMTRLCDAGVMMRLSMVLKPTGRLLDVGCGTGALLEKIRNQFPESDLNGVDLSSGMLNAARSRNILNVILKEGDSEALPYDDDSFDVVTCCSSFHHYPDPDKAMDEFHRVLRPRGHIIICDMHLPTAARLFANSVLFPLQKKGDVHVYTKTEIYCLLKRHRFVYPRVDEISAFEWLATAQAEW